MSTSGVELTVLLPALDEAGSLRRLLPGLGAALARLGASHEILVVDGGSKDDTVRVASELGARVVAQRSPGLGGAYQAGFAAARGKWILTMDADGSHPPEAVAELWRRRAEADLVIGSRFVPGGDARMDLHRWALSRALNALTRLVFALPARDASSGFRLYRARAVEGLPVVTRDFSCQQEILARLLARGARFVEQPFRYEPRLAGSSKASLRRFAVSYVRLFLLLSFLGWDSASKRAFAATAFLTLGLGLWGLSWGLPGADRLRVLPGGERLERGEAERLAGAWRELYQEIRRAHRELAPEEPVTYLRGRVEVEPGWTFPPEPLMSSARSFLLQAVEPDEKKSFIILSQMRPWKLDFQPLYIQYGGAFVYPLGASLALARQLGAAELSSDPTPYLLAPEKMGRLYLVGRLFVALCHALAVLALFDLGRRLSGWRTGLLAAGSYALLPTVLVHAHVIKPHAYAAIWAFAAARWLLAAEREGRRRDYWLCGAAAGLAVGANLTLAPLLAAPLLAWAFTRRPGELRAALGGAAAAAAACLLANPYLLRAPGAFLWEVTVYGAAVWAPPWKALVPALGHAAAAWGLAASALLLLGAAGLARPGRRALAAAALITAAFVAVRLSIWTDAAALRFYLAPAGLLLVLGADLLAARPRVFLLAAALAALELAPRATATLVNIGRETGPAANRARAADWIEAHVPEGATVGLPRFPEPSTTPPFRLNRYRLVLADGPEALEAGPLPEYLVFEERQRAPFANILYKAYGVAAHFPSFQLGRPLPADALGFANPGFTVYRLRQEPP